MYALSDSGAVSYDYTPGWFKEAPVDVMTLTWHDPASVAGVGSDGQTGGDHVLTASNMEPGDRLNFTVEYASWPSTLYWENSRDNLPDNSWGDDSYDDYDDSDDWVFIVFVIFVLVIFFVVRAAVYDGYAGGFGTRYVFVHGLWYPAGPDGHPRPGSVGTKHKPAPPAAAASAAESVAAVLEAVASAETVAIAPALPAVPVPVLAPAPAAAGLAAAPRICMAP